MNNKKILCRNDYSQKDFKSSTMIKIDDDLMAFVSGGITSKEIARGTIKAITSALGGALGGFNGFAALYTCAFACNSSFAILSLIPIGVSGGITAGYQLGNFICSKISSIKQ